MQRIFIRILESFRRSAKVRAATRLSSEPRSNSPGVLVAIVEGNSVLRFKCAIPPDAPDHLCNRFGSPRSDRLERVPTLVVACSKRDESFSAHQALQAGDALT